jgi:hypothetical protein
MQQVNRQRNNAYSLRRRSFAVRRGWPQFYTGLGFFLLGLAITAVYYVFRPGGVIIVMVGSIMIGLIQMARGLGSLSTMRKLEAMQAPLSQREPWLFARAAFAADGSAAEPGWLADPIGSGGLRFWDGQNWTADTRPGTDTFTNLRTGLGICPIGRNEHATFRSIDSRACRFGWSEWMVRAGSNRRPSAFQPDRQLAPESSEVRAVLGPTLRFGCMAVGNGALANVALDRSELTL